MCVLSELKSQRVRQACAVERNTKQHITAACLPLATSLSVSLPVPLSAALSVAR